MIKIFRESGTTANKKRSGRQRTVRCKDGIKRVVIDVHENPHTLIRVSSAQLGLSTGSLCRIMNHLKL